MHIGDVVVLNLHALTVTISRVLPLTMAFSNWKNVIAHAYTSQDASLSLLPQENNDPEAQSTKAVKANFVTPRTPSLRPQTVDGRIPVVPLDETE